MLLGKREHTFDIRRTIGVADSQQRDHPGLPRAGQHLGAVGVKRRPIDVGVRIYVQNYLAVSGTQRIAVRLGAPVRLAVG